MFKLNMTEVTTKRILSIQSHVVSGYAGNKSATFPLQLLGFEVDAINSVQFSNHTGYAGGIRGDVLNSDQLGALIEGLRANNLLNYDVTMTGYIGAVSFLEKLVEVISELKLKNPDMIYVCDPVMGDTDQGWYVPKELLPIYRDKVLPLANFCVPNQFELEALTGMKILNESDAFKAMGSLHAKGVEVVILSSTDISEKKGQLICLASSIKKSKEPEKIKIEFPRLEANFVGTGDLFAALSIAWFIKSGGDIKVALQNTLQTMQAVLRRTLDHCQKIVKPGSKPKAGDLELQLIQSREEILNPKHDTCMNIVEF